MSKAHELTILGKWSETVLPPISPTSPKATKFCCCPNRRRYNVNKHLKEKSTLDARNIFLENDFKYIDDVEPETNGNKSSKATKAAATATKIRIEDDDCGNGNKAYEIQNRKDNEQAYESSANYIKIENDHSDYEEYDDIVDTDGDDALKRPMSCEGTEQKCDKQKQCQHNNNNKNKYNINSYSESINNDCNSSIENSFVTNRPSCDSRKNTAACLNINKTIISSDRSQNECRNHSSNDQKQQQKQIQQQQQQHQHQHQIQRLRNSETNNCNNHKETQNIHQKLSDCRCFYEIIIDDDDDDNNDVDYNHDDDTKATTPEKIATPPTKTTGLNKSSSNYCQRQEQEQRQESAKSTSDSDVFNKQRKIDLPNTMTITTTTNVANRKTSECGLTIPTPKSSSTATSTSTATTTATTTTTATATTTIASPQTTVSPTIMPISPKTPTTVVPPPTTSPRPLTPSLTTVIKTTMVKRSPANESTSAPTTPTIAMASDLCNSNEESIASPDARNGSHYEMNEPTTPTIKERIAALVAGNDRAKFHDNSIRAPQTQCNKNKNTTNMTISRTQNVQSAINSLHHKRQPVISAASNRTDSNTNHCSSSSNSNYNNNKSHNKNLENISIAASASAPSSSSSSAKIHDGAASTSSTSTCTSTSTATTPSRSSLRSSTVRALSSINDIPALRKSGLNDAQKVSFTTSNSSTSTSTASATNSTATDAVVQAALLASNTGCATLPRRRSPASASSSSSSSGLNEKNVLKHGSNTGANMTSADKNCATLMQATTANGGGAASSSLTPSSESTSRKLAALDNLDLALSMDLTDDDGEDPYFALQEYLERVKHEINEVFELHKARQRMQQEQEQKDRQETVNKENAMSETTAASNDELSRSTESDSGFDSASGGHNNSNNNNKSNVNGSNSNNMSKLHMSADGDGDNEKATEICSPNDINVHASIVKSTIPNAEKVANSKQQDMSQIANRKTTKNPTAQPTKTTSDADVEEQTNRRTTTTTTAVTTKKLRALPPPPLNPTPTATDIATTREDVNIWANKFLRDLDNLMANDKPPATTSSSVSSSPTSTTSPMLLSAAAKAAIQSRYGKSPSTISAASSSASASADHHRDLQATGCNSSIVLVRPEKHATIPLQSFNLDCGRSSENNSAGDTGSGSSNASACASKKLNVAYLRTLSAPAPYQQHQRHDNKIAGNASGKNNRNSLADPQLGLHQQQMQQQQQQQQNLTNSQSKNAAMTANEISAKTTTLLKIEETAATSATSGCSKSRISSSAAASASASPSTDAQDNNIMGSINSNEESLKRRRQRQLENDMETIRNSLAAIEAVGYSDKNMAVASTAMATSIPKRERINHATTMTTAGNSAHGGSITTPSKSTSSSTMSALTSSPPTIAKASGISSSSTINSTSSAANGSYLLNGSEATKKGSTSTIWTSEESILRSVGAVDEDNNSTSSSACEEASGILSSGKSGISLDSSGLDNDNNESGIGTATPPKDLAYWKNNHHHHHNHHNDNESQSSFDASRKTKFQKSSSVASSDDPDLLEVLSLCDEPRNAADEDIDESHDDTNDRRRQQQQQQRQQNSERRLSSNHHHNHHYHHHNQRQRGRQQKDENNDSLSSRAPVEAIEATEDSIILDVDETKHADEDDEGHDEFEIAPYCDCDCTDGDASSASGGSGGSGGGPNGIPVATNDTALGNGVVLRRKYPATPIMVPYNSNAGRRQKNRSHSLDTSSLPTTAYHMQNHNPYHPHQHQYHQHPPHHHYHHLSALGGGGGQSQLSRKLHHLQNRGKERGKLSLALRQEPFQSLLAPTHFHELPSPSSASLHSGHEGLGIQELTTKSNSAPLLLKQEKQKRDDFVGQKLSLRYSRSQSDRYLAEIEAVEACKWLRAAGFPQYAQMYEDHQFPIDITNVAKDHTNLENDQLQSLYRRLSTLNRCASMRIDQNHKPQTPQKEESDDENFALSENWTFQPHIRRWSRIGEVSLDLPPTAKLNAEKTESSSKESSPDRFEDDSYDVPGGMLSLTLPAGATVGDTSGVGADDTQDAGEDAAVRLRRTGSERLKDGAKALLRRVESIKSRRRKRQNRDVVVVSGHQALDLSHLGQRSSSRKPDAVYSTPPSPSAVSPMHTFPTKSPFYGNELKVPSQSEHFLTPNRASPKRTPTTPRSVRTSPLHFFSSAMPHLREGKSDDSSSYYSDSQESSGGGKLSLRKMPLKSRRFLQRTGKVDDIGAHSDSECHHGRKLLIKDANSNTTEVKIKKLTRGGSLNLGKDHKKREGFRTSSFRSRSTARKDQKSDDADNIKRSPVVRWHSFQMEERPHMIFRKCFSEKIDPHQNEHGMTFAAMSAGQLQIIRKLALVILTGYMERYCPTHRSGWNWELPKFIKKMKLPPDYKDKKVFGVPLLLVLQRTGQTMPIALRAAFRWLQLNALDQIGLFRKSGVKSRIMRLKELIELTDSTTECMEVFETQQAYDVADMVKQYFRDLPESLLTTKMSETFVAIFQHLPCEVRLDAIQCAVLLLPDENREILFALLEFLTLVAANSKFNQMNANNLAVCLAPSLFHSSISTGAASVTASPRRRNKGGMPDNKELSEAKASHECLAFMIENYRQIYTASKEKIHKCNFGYMEESKPVPLEALGEGMQFHNWRGYLYECTSATIKEGREKTRGWFTITTQIDPNVDVAYKKVGDGHPLRLWRCITEVEGPPREVLEYIIRKRASWDPQLLQCQTVKKLDDRTEIYQYAVDGQVTTDFCVLRSWQTDLPRGACVIVETSIDHAKAKPMFGAVRGVVLASRYLIEPCGSGKSRVMHLARVDIKGRTPEWYNKSFGHICSHYLSKIRSDFKHITDGPESKV